ncbi:hypothetical protein KY329_05490 [Candidatus Woesearchaeota archaeon]|nr:hypothetical protein [Candidatus Woesearchaeota archaeon]
MAKKTTKKMKKKATRTVRKVVTPRIVCGSCEKFSIKSFALAFGLVYAVIMAGFALVAMYGAMEGTTAMMGEVFPGYAATPVGILIAALWGFVMGCIFGGLIAWLYNLFT